MKELKLSLLLLLLTATSFSQGRQKGKTNGKPLWTEFITGDMPLVISVPHGGTAYLPGVGIRRCPNSMTPTDINTIETALEIRKAFLSVYHVSPYLVICHLSRRNVDQNRDINSGTCGNKLMRDSWTSFHHYIDSALALAVKKYGFALYIDLHGHSHPVKRVELGYLLTATQLESAGNTSARIAGKSSLNNLLILKQKKGSPASLRQLLTGKYAFGSLLTNAGIPAFPSCQTAQLQKGEKYYTGGYNIRRYTSGRYPEVFGWQAELNYWGVRDEEGRPNFARVFADAVMKFFRKNVPSNMPSSELLKWPEG